MAPSIDADGNSRRGILFTVNIRNVGLAVFAGALLGAGFLVQALWPLVLVGIVPLLVALRGASLARSCAYGWLASWVISLFALAPILWGSLPLDWYGFSSVWSQWFGVGFSWLLMSAVFALGGALFGALVRWYATSSSLEILVIPSAWVLSEWAGAYLFSIIGAGSGSLIGAHFTLSHIGYILANDSALLQLAQLGDVYALSFAAVSLGTLIFRIISTPSRHEKQLLHALCVALFLIWAAAHPFVSFLSGASRARAEHSADALSIAAVSRYAPPLFLPSPEEEARRFDALRALTTSLRDIDVLVFPENAVFLRTIASSGQTDILRELEKTGNAHPPLVIDSEDIRQENGQLYSRLAYFGTGADPIYSYKEFLLPVGEYFPYVYHYGLQAIGGGAFLQKVLDVRGYAKGPYTNVTSADGVVLAARFCDEVMSPELYRKQVAEGAHVLINLSSQSWFHGSRMVYEEIKQVARVRAVSLGRSYVQSNTMAPAFALDQYGQVVGETRWGEMTVLQVRVPALTAKTLASRAGQYILFVPLAVLFLGLRSGRRVGP